MERVRGIAVSPGVAIGRVYLFEDALKIVARRGIAASHVEREQQRLDAALAESLKELDAMRERAEQELGKEAAAIFAFHQGMLRDPTLTKPMRQRIADDRVTAEYATQEQFKIVAKMFEGMGDSAFSTKVDDVWDLDHRVLRHLVGERRSLLADIKEDVIVLAPDLTPTQTAEFPRGQGSGGGRVLGFVTDMGGPTSHTAIFARALQIPAAVGAGNLCSLAEAGDEVIVDGDTGVIILRPDDETREHYLELQSKGDSLRQSLRAGRELVAETLDGVGIKLVGNIEFGEESHAVLENGGTGVGLFRSEFLWLTRDREPTEEEQYQEFLSAINCGEPSAESPFPVTIRTLDLGADKYTQSRSLSPERNPFLGCRSIRYCLQNIPMFKRHLRAILRASAHGDVRVMFPLITNTMELRQAKMILRDVMEDLSEEGIPYNDQIKIGMMVEVPSAALMARSFAREVDFFSIGTNDLVQYTLAVDRTNERVASLYSAAHPAVLRLIKEVIRVGRRYEVEVSVCGEAGGDPLYTMLLIGLGLRTISLTPSRIPYLKKVIRSVDTTECERVARRVGSFDSEREVLAYMRGVALKRFPEFVDGRAVGDAPG